MGDPIWTDERIATLTEMWTAGESSGAISKRLGVVTRNAVMGKINRLGLMGTQGTNAKAATAIPAQPERAAEVERLRVEAEQAEAERLRVEAEQAEAERLRIEAEEAEAELARFPFVDAPASETSQEVSGGGREPVTVFNIKMDMCRWPFGDPAKPGFHFCGAGTPKGKPYCEEHAAKAFTAPQPRDRKSAAWSQERVIKARQQAIARLQNRRPGKKSLKFAGTAAE